MKKLQMIYWLTMEETETQAISDDGGVRVDVEDGRVKVFLRSDYAAGPDLLLIVREFEAALRRRIDDSIGQEYRLARLHECQAAIAKVEKKEAPSCKE